MKESDLISRQAAIRWVKTECNPYGKPTLDFESGKKVIEHLEQMPTAEERMTGRWIDGFCSECGEEAVTEWNDCGGELLLTRYCPFCGADMRGNADG